MDSILFTTVSNLTGGLVADITTALVALVTIGFIVLGLDLLLRPMATAADEKLSKRKTKKADDSEKPEKTQRERDRDLLLGIVTKKGL